jgi:hypothetical protein
MHTDIFLGNVKRINLGNLGVDGRIILKWILNTWGCEGVDLLYLAQYMVQWQTIVNM